MQSKQSRTLKAFERVQVFLDTNAAVLGAIPTSAPRLALDAVVTSLAGNASDQGTAKIQTRGATASQASLRRALIVTNMRPVAAIAKDKASDIPSVTALVMPKAKVNVMQLVADANAMADAATPYEQTFIDAGLPTDFLAKLRAAAAALNGASTLQGTSKSNSVKATTGVLAEQQKGRSTLNILNTLVQSALAGNTPLLAQWANAKRISPQPASSATAAPSSTTPASTPAPTPAAAANPAAVPVHTTESATHTPEVKAA